MAGVGLGSRMHKSSVAISPVVLLSWDVTDTFRLESDGFGLEARWKLSKRVRLLLEGGYRGRRYRLDGRRGPVDPNDPQSGRVGKGTLRDRNAPILAGVYWRISKHWRLRATAGAVVYQKYTIRDKDGDQVDTASTNDPAFLSRLWLQYRF